MKPRDLIKVLIADDQELTCLGLKILISQQQDCQVVGVPMDAPLRLPPWLRLHGWAHVCAPRQSNDNVNTDDNND